MKDKLRVVYYSLRCYEDHAVILANELAKHLDLLLIMSYAQNIRGKTLPNESAKFIHPMVRKCVLNRKGRFRSPRQFYYDCMLVYWIVKFRPDILLLEEMESPYFVFFYPLIKLLRIRLVYAVHDVEPHSGCGNAFYGILTKIAISFADTAMVFSRNQNQALRRRYNKDGIVIHLPYKSYFETFYLNHTIRRESNTILFFGTIRPNKGLEVLIKAAELARCTIPSLKVIIAGACENFGFYKEFMRTPGIYELHIERIPDEEIGRYFLRSQFLVLPYHDATQSGPLLISLGFNCPVVASDVGGLSEYLSPGITGLFFMRNNHVQLAEIIMHLLDRNDDLKKMQAASRSWVLENFSASRTALHLRTALAESLSS